MIFGLAALFVFQLAGEAVARGLRLPVPGPVVGMVLLWLALALRPTLHQHIQHVAHTLLRNMSLFFIPASVGIITVWPALRDNLAVFVGVVALGTWVTAWVAAATFQALQKRVRS